MMNLSSPSPPNLLGQDLVVFCNWTRHVY